MAKPTERRPQILRVAGEFALIVIGVLVALAADSWWDDRAERGRERAYLSQLRADTEANIERLSLVISEEETAADAKETILTALRSGREIPADSAAEWMGTRRGGMYYSDPRLLDGTLAALFETGDVAIIRDADIRNAAIAYRSELEKDLLEIDRFIERELSYWYTFLERAELGPGLRLDLRRATGSAALQRLRDDERVRVAFRGAAHATRQRLLYLGRILEATRTFERELAATAGR